MVRMEKKSGEQQFGGGHAVLMVRGGEGWFAGITARAGADWDERILVWEVLGGDREHWIRFDEAFTDADGKLMGFYGAGASVILVRSTEERVREVSFKTGDLPGGEVWLEGIRRALRGGDGSEEKGGVQDEQDTGSTDT